MRTLAEFADSHPLGTGTIGVVSGIASKLLAELHFLAGLVADVGAICTGLLAIFTFGIFIANWLRRRRETAAAIAQLEQSERERALRDDYLNYGDE